MDNQNNPNWPNNPNPLDPTSPSATPPSEPTPTFSPLPANPPNQTADAPTPLSSIFGTSPSSPQNAPIQAEAPPTWPLSSSTPLQPNITPQEGAMQQTPQADQMQSLPSWTPTSPTPSPSDPSLPTVSPTFTPSISNLDMNPPTLVDPTQSPHSSFDPTPPSQTPPVEPFSPPPQSIPPDPSSSSQFFPNSNAGIPPQNEPTLNMDQSLSSMNQPPISNPENPFGGGVTPSEPPLPTSPLPQSDQQSMEQNQTLPQPNPYESAPTDLSHLYSSSGGYPQPGGSSQPVVGVPENLVIQSNANPEIPNIPTPDGHKGIPKWIIGVGVGLLLVVIGVSAFFILGIGQPSTKTTSLPATQAPKQTQQPISKPTPTATTQPPGGFGQFEATPAASPMPSPTPSQATSAAELLRQRL